VNDRTFEHYLDVDTLNLPAHSFAAEQAVIGGLLLDNRAYDRICDIISERDFYRADHRLIWHAIAELIERNKPADTVAVLNALGPDHAQLVVELAQSVPSALNIRNHAQIVHDKAILRALTTVGSQIAELALEHGADAQECAEKAEALVLGVSDHGAQNEARDPVPLKDAVFEAVDYLDAERKDGVATGYPAVDSMLPGGGFQPEQLIIIAGRPSMGKSALSYCVSENAAIEGKTVAYFALETSRREIGVRALRWHQSELGRSEAVRKLSGLPIIIDDSPAISLSHMRIRLRRIRRQRGLHMVVVDYLQLMRHRSESRLQEVSEISRGLKAIAKEFSVPVIAVAQLNRQTEGRTDRRPMLSDLRESGQIEQDADVILMCYRDEYYDPKSALVGFGEVFVRKNKDGPTGEALLRWNGPLTRWIHYGGERPEQQQTVLAGSANVKDFRPKGGV
jgi:replicative DNA helicase